jgi:hypothetical protein
MQIGSNSGIMWGVNVHPIQGGSPTPRSRSTSCFR